MSKYETLWNDIKGSDKNNLKLAYDEIKNILCFEIDHSFLKYKKELESYGYKVEKILLKEKYALFSKIWGVMKYIVLLRGINISGKNKISMEELKKY